MTGFQSGIGSSLASVSLPAFTFFVGNQWLLGSAAFPVCFLVADPCSQEVTFTASGKVILQ